VEKMLDRYARMVQELREHRPDVQLVHATVPLRADPPGWKTTVKRLIGRATDEDGANVLRNQFNAGLRQRFAREPIFDLAAAESTLADGSRSSFTQDGRTIYTLEPRYTTDGGHLNEEGQRWVAAQFLRAVAQALRPRTQDRE
jgi:lysophospholipase L1-like esterase